MATFRRPERTDAREIEALAGLRPLVDPVFDHLLQSALDNRLDVYFAAVPTSAKRPFDPVYDPRRHPVGEKAIQAVVRDWRHGKTTTIWVHQKGPEFIMSDDYVIWEAVKEGQPDYVPCWVLGRPDHPEVRDIQGPLDQPSVRRALGDRK